MVLSQVVDVDKDKCLNCHLCIKVCPVKYCNIAEDDYVKVDSDLCIGCGECVHACPHDARYIIDDFEKALKALENGEKIIAVVAPSVAANFPNEYLNLNGWLKSKGIEAFFDVSFGAELTVKTYLEYIKDNNPKTVIAQPCPALVSYIEIYRPELLPHLAPADSPMMHTMKMVHQFYPQYKNHKILVVSPCVAKRREFDEVGLGDYNVTIKNLKDYIESHEINLKKYDALDYDNDPAERAVLFSTPGGLMRTVQRENPGAVNVTRKIEGPATIYHYLSHLSKDIDKGIAPLLVDCLNCELGCNGGSGTHRDKSQDEVEHLIEERNKQAQAKYAKKGILGKKLAKRKLEKTINKYWEKDLYGRKYVNLSESNYKKKIKIPSEAEIDKIYRQMSKTKKEDIKNCGSCGYDSCEQMAIAIYNNLNVIENCYDRNKALSHSFHYVIEEINKFAEGDFTIKLKIDHNDEAGKLYETFNKAVANLNEMITSVVEVIRYALSSSNEIFNSTQELAASSNEQSIQAAEISAAVEEMIKAIVDTSNGSSLASDASKDAGRIALEGGEVVGQTVEGMNRIAEVVIKSSESVMELGKGSRQIGEIIQVIDDIANQTNLLALNAAIEAARAGEQGRGFAVVADEVKKLSERTTKATKEISAMINKIQKETSDAVQLIQRGKDEVEKGKQLADGAGSSLNEIMKGTDKVVEIISQVAGMSEEQTVASEKISSNVEVISSEIQKNASATQKITGSVEKLIELNKHLEKLISKFKLVENNNGNGKAARFLN